MPGETDSHSEWTVFTTQNSTYALRALGDKPASQQIELCCLRGTLEKKGSYIGYAPYGFPKLGELFVFFTEARGDITTSPVREVRPYDSRKDGGIPESS